MHGRGFRNSERTEMGSTRKLGYFRPVKLLSTKYLKLVVWEFPSGSVVRTLRSRG